MFAADFRPWTLTLPLMSPAKLQTDARSTVKLNTTVFTAKFASFISFSFASIVSFPNIHSNSELSLERIINARHESMWTEEQVVTRIVRIGVRQRPVILVFSRNLDVRAYQ